MRDLAQTAKQHCRIVPGCMMVNWNLAADGCGSMMVRMALPRGARLPSTKARL